MAPLPTAPIPTGGKKEDSEGSLFLSGDGIPTGSFPTGSYGIPGRTPSSGVYKSVGNLTAEQLLSNEFSRWEYLEPKVEELSTWVQDTLAENNKTDEVGAARLERGQKYRDMMKTLDRMILSHIASDKSIVPSDKPYLVARVTNEVLGLGPLEPLWNDTSITEIVADGPYKIRIERSGQLFDVPGARFRDAQHLLNLCQSILAPLNRTLDVANPLEDGRLPDKSRVNVVHPVIAPGGPLLTIRRHREEAWTIKELVERGALTEEIAKELAFLIHSRVSTLVVGGTGTGKMLTHDTILPTPSGFTTMGEVNIGDALLDENGNPTTVTAKYSLKKPVPYRVIFSDGSEVIADEDHNWLTSTRAARRSEYLSKRVESNRVRRERMSDGELVVLKMKQRAALESDFVSRREMLDLFPQHTSMITSFLASNPVVLSTREHTGESLPGRERYRYPARTLFSALLDYCSAPVRDQRHKMVRSSVVTTKEIQETLKTSTGHTNHAVAVLSAPVQYEHRNDLPVPPKDAGVLLGVAARSADGVVDGLEALLGAEGALLVPDAYRFSSVAQRKELLTGFMDVAASASCRTPTIKVSSRHHDLLRSVASVLSSLAFKPSVLVDDSGMSRLSVRATETMFTDEVKHTRHQKASAATSENVARDGWRYIVDVVPYEGDVQMSCVTVDSANSLYLCTENFIITHNTTVLNALSGLIPANERIVTIEDNLELQLHPDRMVASMEGRPSGASNRGAITIRDLVRNALRMRPDRIVVGEVRDAAAFDMLQAMNTGHDGSLTTFHANGAEEAIPRLESMVMQSGELNPTGVKALIAGAVDIIVIVSRYPEDGSRRISGVYEVPARLGVDESGTQVLHPVPLWEFVHDKTVDGKVVGHYEKFNELSPELIRKHRLAQRPRLSLEEVYELGKLASDEDERSEETSLHADIEL